MFLTPNYLKAVPEITQTRKQSNFLMVMLHINNGPLKEVSIAKYLGMYINENLKWVERINVMIPNKISAKIGILRSLKRIVPIDTLKLLYNAIILPHFDYSDMVYDSASETSKLRLRSYRHE